MTKEKFYHGLTEISEKYIREADIFGPVKPEKSSPVSAVLRWGCAAAACLVVGLGIWLLGENGLLPIASVQPQSRKPASLGSVVNGAEVLSENTVTINQDGSLTFTNPEFQEIQQVFLRHEPVIVGEMREEQGTPILETSDGTKYALSETEDPVDRILTLTLPLFVADRYTVADRTNLLCQLMETDYYFCKPEDGSPAYLKSAPRFGGLAGVIGYYDEEHTYHAEQPRYADKENYEDLLQELMGTESESGTSLSVSSEPKGDSADTASLPPESLRGFNGGTQSQSEGPYQKWEKYGGENLIYKLLYSYLEQNGLLEYARVQLPGVKEMVELSGGDSVVDAEPQQSDAPLLWRDALFIDEKGTLTFSDPEYQEYYDTFREHFGAYGDLASAMGEEKCTDILRLPLPYYELGRYSAEDGTLHVLLLLESTDYGFFETDGVKTVKPISAYSDLAGVVVVPQDSRIVSFWGKETWYPKDGSDYLPSIARFTGLTEEETSALLEKAKQKRNAFNKDGEQAGDIAQQLLFAYMFQNDLTGYQLQDGEARSITEEELHTAASLNVSAEETIKMDLQQLLVKMENLHEQEEVIAAARDMAQEYVNQWLSNPEHPLAECFYQNLSVKYVSENEDGFVLGLRMVFKVKDEKDLNYWMAGNAKEGTGENAGYYTAARYVQVGTSDGEWTILDSGTGDYGSIPGMRKVDWRIE